MTSTVLTHVALITAIACETIGTAALQQSDGFTRPLPSLVALAAYAAAFWFLAMVLRVMSVGIAYAIWSGVGIVFITVIGFVAFGQKLDLAAIVGLGLILAGVVVINLFSDSVYHG